MRMEVRGPGVGSPLTFHIVQGWTSGQLACWQAHSPALLPASSFNFLRDLHTIFKSSHTALPSQ